VRISIYVQVAFMAIIIMALVIIVPAPIMLYIAGSLALMALAGEAFDVELRDEDNFFRHYYQISIKQLVRYKQRLISYVSIALAIVLIIEALAIAHPGILIVASCVPIVALVILDTCGLCWALALLTVVRGHKSDFITVIVCLPAAIVPFLSLAYVAVARRALIKRGLVHAPGK
jgi:amino acid permease